MSDDPRLDDLAGRILDGHAVDWKAEASPGTAADQSMLAELKVLADIVDLHRRGQGAAGSGSGEASQARSQGSSQPGLGTWGTLALLEKVGEGAFAEVYRARDPHLDRDVALKLLRGDRPDADVGDAVIEEGRLLASVHHPNVVVVHGAGEFDGRVGIWTEFVQGQTLEDVLADHGPFGSHEAALVGVDLCRALAAVHGAGVVHRDVKARNVMRERGGRVVLMDFGMGRTAAGSRPDRGSSGGTPLYMAPELFAGRPATVQSDIYALGVLLWHLLTGAYPVTGTSLQEVRAAHEAGTRARLRDQRPDLPATVGAAVERAVAPDPARRHESAGAFEAALAAALGVGQGWAGTPRWRLWRMAGAAAVVVALAGGGWYLVRRPLALPLVAFEERDWVLVGAFENRSGDPRLNGMIEAALEREMAESRFVNVVPRERVNDTLRLMKKPASTVLDAGIGLEVCRRDGGIRGFVTGRIEKLGSAIVVSAIVHDPAAAGRPMVAASSQAAAEASLPSAVRAISDQIRQRLGEEPRHVIDSGQRLEKVTTPSFEAAKLYTAGMTATNERNAPVAARLFAQALDADPDFASAHIMLAHALRNTNRPESEYVPHAERAFRLADTASERERGFIQGSYYSMIGDREKAASAYAALLRLYPDDYWATNNLRFTLDELGRRAETWPLSIRMAELRPNDYVSNIAAARATMEYGRSVAEVRPFVDRLRRLEAPASGPINGTWVRLFPACEAWLSSDQAGAAAIVREVAERKNATRGDLLQAGRYDLGLGLIAEAERVFQLLPAGIDRDVQMAEAASFRSGSIALRDRLRQALAATRPPDALAAATAINLDMLSAMLGEAGLVADAQRLLAAREAGSAAPWVAPYLALLARPDEKTIAEAERARATRALPRSTFSLLMARTIATALARRRDLRRAVRLLEQASENRLVCHPSGPALAYWLSVKAQLATLYRQTGRAKDADVIDAQLLRLLAKADPDFIVLTQIAH